MRRLPIVGLTALAGVLAGPRCPRPPPSEVQAAPVVRDAGEAVEPDALGAWIATTEELRGLRFIQRPTLELVAGDDPRLPALLAEVSARDPLPDRIRPSEPVQGEVVAGSCFPDFERARVLCVAQPEQSSFRKSLARLLDQQHHPRLVASAPRLRGDPGVAVRSLLAASAAAAADAGLGPAPKEEPAGFLAQAEIPLEGAVDANQLLTFAAALFLAGQRDREAPFRAPPLSTKQMLSPPAYRAGERPLLLEGAPPELPGCAVSSDESVGVGRLIATRLGSSAPGAALARWRGDRAVRFACEDGSQPWLYAADFADEPSAQALLAVAETLVPVEFPRPLAGGRTGRRVALWHALPATTARAWASSLAARELTRLDALD